MKFCLFIAIFFSLAYTLKAQTTEGYILKGRIIADSTLAALPGAHIVSKATLKATVSGTEGSFNLYANPGDTLYISYIGYKTLRWPIASNPKQIVDIKLTLSTEQLQEVVVEGLPSERVLKNRILALELPNEESVALDLPKWASNPVSDNQGVGVVALRGGISGIANKLNKKERGRIFNAKLVQQHNEAQIIAGKYNDAVIMIATGISEETTLIKFKKFCELPHNFLLAATEYDIHKAIAECFADFEAAQATEQKG